MSTSEYLNSLKTEYALDNHSLFKYIKSHHCQPIILSQILSPFYFAVTEWQEHLEKFYKLLLGSSDIDSAKLVLENIMDERSYDNKSKAHPQTYLGFLTALGKKDLNLTSSPAVNKFNNELSSMLKSKEVTLGEMAAVFGGIEYFYISISSFLHYHLSNVYQISQEHYTLHEIIDQKHSMDFFIVADNQKVLNSEMKRGVKKGFNLLWNLYEDLYQEYFDNLQFN
jgi:hypothetical protein